METALRQFAARQDHQSSDSTFLVFMSHGILDGICGTKHREQQPYILHDDTIFQIFNNHNCQSLKDKPKVILMQACRGKGSGIVWVTDMGEDSAYRYGQSLQCSIWNDAITKTHVEKDFIAFKSSTPCSTFVWDPRCTDSDAHDWKSIHDTIFLPLPWELKPI